MRAKRQLIFLSGALECFRLVLDPIEDLIVFLDRHQSNDLVLAVAAWILERTFEMNRPGQLNIYASFAGDLSAIRCHV